MRGPAVEVHYAQRGKVTKLLAGRGSHTGRERPCTCRTVAEWRAAKSLSLLLPELLLDHDQELILRDLFAVLDQPRFERLPGGVQQVVGGRIVVRGCGGGDG